MTPLGPRSDALQHLRRLSGRRRARRDAGAFVVDGPTLVGEALAAPGLTVDEVYVEVTAGAEAPGTTVADLAAEVGVPVRVVADGALAKVTSPVTPQGVAALARIPEPATDSWSGLVLVLVGVADPGNVGTLVRVAEAAGATAVVSCADAADPWNPKSVRAAAGSSFRVPVVELDDAVDVVRRLGDAGMTTVATVVRGGVDPDAVALDADVAVLLGSEAHGLPAAVVDAADAAVSIPMAGQVESLNVAMCGTVLAFESARRRRAAGGAAR